MTVAIEPSNQRPVDRRFVRVGAILDSGYFDQKWIMERDLNVMHANGIEAILSSNQIMLIALTNILKGFFEINY